MGTLGCQTFFSGLLSVNITEEIEKNLAEKQIGIAKCLINTISTLNSTVVKKREIQEEIDKCGRCCKNRKMIIECISCEHDSVLLEFRTWMGCVVIVWVGGPLGNVGEEHDLEQVHSVGELHVADETRKSSLHAC